MCVALPGKVIWIGEPGDGTIPARAELPTGAVDIDLILVPTTEIGDYVVTHAGFALRTVSPDEAKRSLYLAGLERD